MPDPETSARLDDYLACALASFPLSRVTKEFHDEMLGVLPPVHIKGVPGFFVSEALTDGIHAQFVNLVGYAAINHPPSHITYKKIAAFEAASPDPPILTWYPELAGDAAA
jgi:hypothetical protein